MHLWAAISSFTARDPTMLKWSGLLSRLGGGRQPHFTEDFFIQLDQDILVVDDYGYAGIEFRQDADLALPDDEDWDASLGKKHVISFPVIFVCFLFCDVFCEWYNKKTSFVIYRLSTGMTNEDVSDTVPWITEDRSGTERH